MSKVTVFISEMASLVRGTRLPVSLLSYRYRGIAGWRLRSDDSSAPTVVKTADSSAPTVVKTADSEALIERVSPDELVSVSEISGIPDEQLKRVARIFMPAQHAMQSGSANTHCWKIEFDNQERWENPLIGWSSSADPLSCLSLEFDTKEQAIAYAVKNGWGHEVQEPKKATPRAKSYAANFSWDKKTRIVTK